MLDARENSEEKRLDDDEIVAQSILFLIAGYETTSTTLGFLCHHLAVDTAIQDKIRQEIDEKWTDDEVRNCSFYSPHLRMKQWLE